MDLACSYCKFGLGQSKKLSKHFAITCSQYSLITHYKFIKNNDNLSLYLK